MAKKSFSAGIIPPYGVAIGNAIASSSTTVDELLALRSQAQAIVEGHGDLTAAITALDKEIASRGGPASSTGAPAQRFVVETVGLTIPPDAKLKIEQAINEAVKTTLARHDAGPVVITPLSQIKSFGAGLGGATAGMIARIEKIR